MSRLANESTKDDMRLARFALVELWRLFVVARLVGLLIKNHWPETQNATVSPPPCKRGLVLLRVYLLTLVHGRGGGDQ